MRFLAFLLLPAALLVGQSKHGKTINGVERLLYVTNKTGSVLQAVTGTNPLHHCVEGESADRYFPVLMYWMQSPWFLKPVPLARESVFQPSPLH